MLYQGIDTSRRWNITRLSIDDGKAVNVAADNAVAAAYGNRFNILLAFELLLSHDILPECTGGPFRIRTIVQRVYPCSHNH